MRTLVLCSAVLFCALPAANAQEPIPAGKKDPDSLNAVIVAARKATAEKRFADSEAMMSKVTSEDPKLSSALGGTWVGAAWTEEVPRGRKQFQDGPGHRFELDPASAFR